MKRKEKKPDASPSERSGFAGWSEQDDAQNNKEKKDTSGDFSTARDRGPNNVVKE